MGPATGILRAFTRRLDSFDQTARNTLLTGVRGTGKSSLLTEFEHNAVERDWLVDRQTLTPGLNNEADLAQTFSTQARRVVDELSGVERWRRRLKTAREGITIEIPLPEVGRVGFRLSGNAAAMTFEEAMSQSLTRIGEAARDGSRWRGVLFIYDEAHCLFDRPTDMQFPLSALSKAFTSVQSESLPVMLVLSGLPTVRRLLARAQPNASRAFDPDELEALRLAPGPPSEAANALTDIGERGGILYDGDAAEQVALDADGYLAGIQALGYRVVEQAFLLETEVIDRAFYDAHRKSLLRFLDESLYLGVFEDIAQEQRELLYAAADLAEPFSIDVLPSSIQQPDLISGLLDAGLLYEAERERYAFTYGGFGAFLRRHRPDEPGG